MMQILKKQNIWAKLQIYLKRIKGDFHNFINEKQWIINAK